MPIDQEKLAKLQKLSANNKVGGTRRKLTKKTGSASGANKDDTQLQAQLAKLRAVTIAVSYTHLDVYKRQVKALPTHSISG